MTDLIIVFTIFGGFFFLIFAVMRYAINHSPEWQCFLESYESAVEPTDLTATNLKIRHIKMDGAESTGLIKFYKMNQGLLLSQSKIIRRGASNILIPWEDIVQVRRRKVAIQNWVRLVIGDPFEKKFVGYIDIHPSGFEQMRDKLSHLKE